MAQASNLTELRAALNQQQPFIEITADIEVTSQLSVSYSVEIYSLAPNRYTLSKTSGFRWSLISVQNGGHLTLRDIILDGQQAGRYDVNGDNRSLIIVAGGTLDAGDGVILQNNSSYQEGGGIYLSGNENYVNELVMSGNARITGCESRTSGGGLMVAVRNSGDRVTLSGELYFGANHAANGGGIYFRSYVQGVAGELRLSDTVRITGNEADAAGGGINFSGFRSGESPNSALIIGPGVSVDNNQASNGGGVYFYGSNESELFQTAGDIENNTASGNGGGLYVRGALGGNSGTGGVQFEMNGGSLKDNTAGTGGGVYLLTDSAGSVLFSGASVLRNQAGNGASGSGGGIWLQNTFAEQSVSLTIENTVVEGNQASAAGGGLTFNGGPGRFSFEGRDSIFSGNQAGGNGGGILVGTAAGGSLNLHSVTISGNTSQGYGGGFYFTNTTAAADSVLMLNEVTVNDNYALTEGGGLRIASGGGALRTTLTDCGITENTADRSSGGGVWNGGSNAMLSIEGTTAIDGNHSLAGNGGGIYVNGVNSSLILSDSVRVVNNRADERVSLTGNNGGGICMISGRVEIRDQVEIAFNRALKSGGGISASENSAISMTGGSIHDNQAGIYGGGVRNHSGSSFLLTGGSVSRNTALVGGGLYNNSQSRAIVSEAGLLSGNQATSYAPGIYNGGELYTEGLRDLENGVYLVNRSSVVFLQGPLAEGTVIQLDLSNYVMPNSEGTPIVVGEATDSYPVLTQTDADGFRKPLRDFNGWEIRLSDDRTQVLLTPEVYSIHYENLMGAQHANPTSYTVLTPDILLTAPQPVIGYRFAGWFDALTGGNQVTSIPQGSTGDRILYARWDEVLYQITYHGNDAGGPEAQWVPFPQQVREGERVVLSSSFPTRNGYRFTGWNTDPAGTGAVYQPGELIGPMTGDLDLHAQWRRAEPNPPAILPPSGSCCRPCKVCRPCESCRKPDETCRP